jgi:uncharacterized membrane protein YdjX (TVP38/TMEM64 family)
MMSTLPEQQTTSTPAPARDTFWSRNWQKITAVVIWVAIVASFFIYSTLAYGSPLAFDRTLRDLVGLLESPLGPLVFVVVYALRPLAFFSATVLTLLGGAIWGPFLGILMTIIAANISASVAFLLGRLLGQDVIDESESGGVLSNYAGRLRRNAFQTILIMRLIYLPYDLVNYLSGFLRVDYRPFILATALGSLPGTVTFVLAGASVNLAQVFEGGIDASVFNPWALGASAVIFVVSLIVSRYVRSHEEEVLPEEQPEPQDTQA